MLYTTTAEQALKTVRWEGVCSCEPSHKGLNNGATNMPATLPHPTQPDSHNRFLLLSFFLCSTTTMSPVLLLHYLADHIKRASCWITNPCVFLADPRPKTQVWGGVTKDTPSKSHLKQSAENQCPQREGGTGTIQNQNLISKPRLDFEPLLRLWRGGLTHHFRVLSPVLRINQMPCCLVTWSQKSGVRILKYHYTCLLAVLRF